MKLNNLTASAFAETIGVQPSSVSHILSGRNKPSLEFIQKIISKYPKIDAAWLINGTTSVQEEKVTPEPIEKEIKKKENTVEEKGENKTIHVNDQQSIEKIVVFYTNGTFKEYFGKP